MKGLVFSLVLLITFSLRSQVLSLDKDLIIEETIEFIASQNENEDIDYTSLVESYYLFLDHPINLNSTSFEQLSQLHLLSDLQILSILDYRLQYYQFLTLYELKAIPELDNVIISKLLPFIYIGDLSSEEINWQDAMKQGEHDVLLRYQRVLERKKGYAPFNDSISQQHSNNTYQGNADKYYLRYRYTYNNKVSYGLTAEKDPGESFFRSSNKQGFDFYSGHFMLGNAKKIKRLIIGDYHANFGQGLNIWTGFNMGRTIQTLNVKQYGNGLKPYTSANENQFFRGIGITFDLNRVETTFFGSYKRVDVNIEINDTLESVSRVNSFYLSGYHRTLKEIEREKTLGELVIGTSTSFQTKKLKVNMTGLFVKFSKPIENNQILYRQFDFVGDKQLSFGLDYQYYVSKLSLFGEVSTGLNGRINAINGCLWKIDPKLDFLIVHRYFDKANQNLYGNNFFGRSQNESGTYVGIKANVNAHLKTSFYLDQSRSNWFRYLINSPSTERSFVGQIDYSINKNSNFYIRFSARYNARNTRSGLTDGIVAQTEQSTKRLRLNYSQYINAQFLIKSRIEFSKYTLDTEPSKGMMMYQDIIYTHKAKRFKFYVRYGLFDTDDYNTRIYAFEHDLLYVFNVPASFYQGFRTYMMARYKVNRQISVWLKWGRTSYVNQEKISSGLEEINGHHKSDIRAQIKIKF